MRNATVASSSSASNVFDVYECFLQDTSDTKFSFKKILDKLALDDLTQSINCFLKEVNFTDWHDGEERKKQIEVLLARMLKSQNNANIVTAIRNAIYNQLVYLCVNRQQSAVAVNDNSQFGAPLDPEEGIDILLKDPSKLASLGINDAILFQMLSNGASKAHIISILEMAADLQKWCISLPGGLRISNYIFSFFPTLCLDTLSNSDDKESRHAEILELNNKIEKIVGYCNKLSSNASHKTCLNLYAFLQVVCLGGENRERLGQFIGVEITRVQIVNLYKGLFKHFIRTAGLGVSVSSDLVEDDKVDMSWQNYVDEHNEVNVTPTSEFISQYAALALFDENSYEMEESELIDEITKHMMHIIDVSSTEGSLGNLDLRNLDFINCIANGVSNGHAILFAILLYSNLCIHIEENDFVSIKLCSELIDNYQLSLDLELHPKWPKSLTEQLISLQNKLRKLCNVEDLYIEWSDFENIMFNLGEVVENLVFGHRALSNLQAVSLIANIARNYSDTLVKYLAGEDYKDLALIKQFCYPNVLHFLNPENAISRSILLESPYKRALLQLREYNTNFTAIFGRTADQVHRFLLACREMPFLVAMPFLYSVPLYFDQKEKLALIKRLVNKFQCNNTRFIQQLASSVSLSELKELDQQAISSIGLSKSYQYMKEHPAKYSLVLNIDRLYGLRRSGVLALFKLGPQILQLLINEHFVIKYLVYTKNCINYEDILNYKHHFAGWKFLIKLSHQIIKSMPNSDAVFQQLQKVLIFEKNRFFQLFECKELMTAFESMGEAQYKLLFGMICLIYKHYYEPSTLSVSDDAHLREDLMQFIEFYKSYGKEVEGSITHLHMVMAFDDSKKFFDNDSYQYFIKFMSRVASEGLIKEYSPKSIKDLALKVGFLQASHCSVEKLPIMPLLKVFNDPKFESAVKLLTDVKYHRLRFDNNGSSEDFLQSVKDGVISASEKYKTIISSLNTLDLNWRNVSKRMRVFTLDDQVRLMKFIEENKSIINSTPDQLLTLLYNQFSHNEKMVSWLLSSDGKVCIMNMNAATAKLIEWQDIKEKFTELRL